MRDAADLLLAATEARRVQLGKKWKQVYEEAGLTHQTLNRWRNGHGVDPLTERALERALSWAPGARAAIAAGLSPGELDSASTPAPPNETYAASPSLEQELELAARLMAAQIRELGLSPDEAEEAWERARARIVSTHRAGPPAERDDGVEGPRGRRSAG